MQESILILDFGSQVTQLIGRRLREMNVYCEIHPYNKIPELTPDIKGVILSGSPLWGIFTVLIFSKVNKCRTTLEDILPNRLYGSTNPTNSDTPQSILTNIKTKNAIRKTGCPGRYCRSFLRKIQRSRRSITSCSKPSGQHHEQ